MPRLRWLPVAAVIALAAALGTPGNALAQQSSEQDIFAPVTQGAAQAPTQQAPAQAPAQAPKKQAKKQTGQTQAAAQKPADAAAAPDAGKSELEQRLGQIEEQVADMQVVVGTYESMGRSRGTLPPAGADPLPGDVGSGEVEARVGKLEAQLQSLSGQLADLANQVRLLNGKVAGAPAAKPQAPAAADGQQGALIGKNLGMTADAGGSLMGEQPAAADTSGFGQTTVTGAAGMQGQDTIGQMIDGDPAAVPPPDPNADLAAPPQASQDGQQVASLGQAATDPQQAYDEAYGHILQQDFSGAEVAFRNYIVQFPRTTLASNAHYWLGQSYYARGQYKQAADAFLKGYSTYKTGQKAPDSLLKLGMSLSRLGQKDAACSAFTALDSEFPNAGSQIKRIAESERERTGC